MRLTAEVEPIRTGPQPEPPSDPVGTPAGQHASTPENWVNFSTYLPAPVRRKLRSRCALLNIEQRQAVTEAVLAWLDEHPADED